MAAPTKAEAFWAGVVGFILTMFVFSAVYFSYQSAYRAGYNDAERCFRYQIGCYKIKEIVSK